jgi:hypothetical protein
MKKTLIHLVLIIFIGSAIFSSCKSKEESPAKTYIDTVGQEYGGGIIAYILQPGDLGYIDGEKHGLIAAPTDLVRGAEWGCSGTLISGADSTKIGYGNQNTMDIIAGCTTAHIAAKFCSDLMLRGYDDWYLPGKDELNKIYLNKYIIGGFANTFYWSSSEINDSCAWSQNFTDGTQVSDSLKTTQNYVRAIRSF